ncbi:MAG: hypothetical protein AB9842_13255 [Bacteroidales bacterium]
MNNTSPFFVYVRKLILFTVIVTIVLYAVRFFLSPHWRTPALPYLIPLFLSVNIVIHYILLKTTAKKFSSFVSYYMAGTMGKLLLYIIILLVYIYLHRADALPFTLTFLLLYILYTTFEVISLLANNTQPPGNQTE